MQRSNVAREKLLSGHTLLLIAALFTVAFSVLKPSEGEFSFGKSKETILKPDSVDELELAYLRARVATGEQSSAEVSDAVSRLVNAGHFNKASTLLTEHPDVQLEDSVRYRLELEQAIVAYQKSGENQGQEMQTGQVALLGKLQHLLDNPALRSVSTLRRAAAISVTLPEKLVSASLYKALGVADTNRSTHWFEQCGVYASAAGATDQAQQCYQEALQSTDDPDRQFAIKVVQLRQMAGDREISAQQELIDELVTHQPISISQLDELSVALLAIERPDMAVDSYVRLAKQDQNNKTKWLTEAARWAVASNQNNRAVDFLVEVRQASDADEARQVDLQIENLLIAAGEQKRVLDRTESRIAANPTDLESIEAGVVLAQQLGSTQKALDWNTLLLDLEPLNQVALLRQARLLLGNGEQVAAKGWAQRIVDNYPNDRDARILLAQISEWTGEPYAAVEHWQQVNRLAADLDSLDQLVRLAEMTMRPALAAQVMQQRIAHAEPTDAQLKRLIKLHELSGQSEEAIRAIERTIARYGATSPRFQMMAQLHQHHSQLQDALATWQRHDRVLSRTEESLLNQIELHWRLNQTDLAANLSREFKGNMLPASTTDYQARVIAEIAWRYEYPELTMLAAPQLEKWNAVTQDAEAGRRVLVVMKELGQFNDAIDEAEQLWMDSGQVEFALSAMDVRFKRGDSKFPVYLTETSNRNVSLQQTPGYWNLIAAMHIRNNLSDEAQQAYQQALSIQPDNLDGLGGLLWLYIANNEQAGMNQLVQSYHETALDQPLLWTPFAVAHMQLGNVQDSLFWFARLGTRIDADYSTLLLYADALELAEQADKARKLRQYVLQELRPLLADESAAEHAMLLRQYSRLLATYGSASEQEQLNRYLLSAEHKPADNANFWREDIAIAWLMSTQRHEHARVIMSRIHQQRLNLPVWQQMALALKSKDEAALQSILALGGPVSAGNRILALRTLGDDQQAHSLARKVRESGNTLSERQLAAEQYASLRSRRPSYAASSINTLSMASLSIDEVGLSARHTFSLSDFGISVDYVQRYLDSSRFDLDDTNNQSDVAVSLYYTAGRRGGNITTGFLSSGEFDHVYVDGLYYQTSRDGLRSYTTQVAYNEAATQSAELRVAGKQNRATFALDAGFGGNEFVKFQLDASEIKTRVNDKRVARGIQARAEIGFRGTVGSHRWITSLLADNRSFERVEVLPEELRLTSDTTLDSVLASDVTSLSVGASLARGEVNSTYPQTSAPRYYLNTRLGHTWPDRSYGLQIDAGAGIRLMGGDELSFGFSHETLSSKPSTGDSNTSSFGVNYRFHF